MCRIQSSTETRKLATMMPIATIRLKLASTPPNAIEAWPGAFASRASARFSTGDCAAAGRRSCRRFSRRKLAAARRGIRPIPPISSRATAK